MAQEASDVTANKQKAQEGRFTVKWRAGGDPNTRADQKHDVLGVCILASKVLETLPVSNTLNNMEVLALN